MASSSSLISSITSSLSSSQHCIHEVFPSFSGKDVRKTFLSHLLKEFQRKGIETFNDDGMVKKGHSIGPELMEAIRRSRISLVVLSKNYASSSWCLNELVEILTSRENAGQTVMTIFYGVDPSDVRKQLGKFGKNFEITCTGKTEDETLIWRQALTDIANIAGENSEKWDNEADMVEKVVKDVSNKLNTTPSLDFDNLVGVKAHVKQLSSLLCLKRVDEVRMVGIWGAAGIGKTTIARALYNQISEYFQLSVFMDNTKESYKGINIIDDYGLKLRFQEQFLSKIFGHREIRVQHLGAIEERLKNKRVIVVLDDVDEIEQLVSLANQTTWFGLGSRIIVTTEDRELLKTHGINDVYKVDFPSCDEAIQIFSRYAFRQTLPPQKFMELSIKITKLVGNLPLGLSVLGSSLRGKSKEEWLVTLPRLRSSLDAKFEKILEVGYNCLHEKDKAIFLHIACFFNGEKVDRIIQLLATTDLDIVFGLKFLANKSLVHISTDGRVMMHSLLQKLGREVVRKQSIYEPGKRQFLVNSEEICDVLQDETGTRSVLGISLDISRTNKLSISKKSFKKMRNLQFLRFYANSMGEMYGLKISKRLGCLPNKLRLLHWNAYPWKNIPSKFCSKYLVELNMQHSKLEKLWDGTQPLRNLRQMDLSFSKKLGEIPDLSEAKNLQTLDLSYCESISSISSSIGELKKLKDLTMFGCTKLEALPTNLDLASLDSLYMDGCSRLKSFPEISRNIQFLYLGETAIEEVPSSITSWTRLMEFNMSGSKRLKTFPHVPDSVRVLSLGNNEFQNIPFGRIKPMSQLRSLDLTDCRKLVSLPELPEFLSYINADNCESLERISHLSFSPNNVLELGNCAKLDQESRNLVETSECGYAFLPGGEVPAYFTYRTSSGSSLNNHLDHQNNSLSAVTGFKACVVLAAGSNSDVLSVNGVTGLSCCFKSKYNGSSIQYYEWPVMYPSLLLTDHRCILNVVLEDDNNNDGKGRRLRGQEMCFEFCCLHYKIIGCGVRLLTGHEEEESFNGRFGIKFREMFEEKDGERKKSKKRKIVNNDRFVYTC